jgi:hypothetical protein
MNRLPIMFVALAACSFGAPALAQHQDVALLVDGEGGRFVTGAVDFDQGGGVLEGVRVFCRDFGEAGQPQFTDDPGFSSPDGSLPANMLVGFDLVDALRVWDAAAQDFETVAPETISVNKFAAVATTPASPEGFAPGFWFAATGVSGGMHEHINYFLNAPAGNAIFLLTMALRTDHPTFEDPAPIFIIFNHNAPDAEAQMALAKAHVENLIAPPACSGDIDGDNDTDVLDFAQFLTEFGTDVEPGTGADLNADGSVDVLDFALFVADFGCPEGGPGT